jgi:hypothetical protein
MRNKFTVVIGNNMIVFSEAKSSWHSIYHPAAQQNCSILGLRKFDILLINWFSNNVPLKFGMFILFFCFLNELWKCFEIIAEKNSVSFSSKFWLANPFFNFQILITHFKFINAIYFVIFFILSKLDMRINKICRK